jgi:hypothetical protein
MTRRSRTLRGATLVASVLLLLGPSAVAASTAGAIPASKCTQAIVISGLAFGPGTVVPGGTSTARLSGMNCTRHAQSVTVTWLGHYAGSSLTGCPAIDPLPQSVAVAASSTMKAHVSYGVPKACVAKSLVVSTRITGAQGKVIARKSASLRIAHKKVG